MNKMKKINKTYRILLILLAVNLLSCTEEFVPKTESFENILVVEANITDELKNQEVLLSRTFPFEEEIRGESNAEVKVIDDQNNEYLFQETDPGKYMSVSTFQAVPSRVYNLSIKTSDGKSYTSDSAVLPQKTEIDNLYAERMINDDGIDGVGIFVDSFDPTGNASFYRYEYEETFRFKAPEFNAQDFVIVNEVPLEVEFVTRPPEKETCYKTNLSSDIILTKTGDLNENKVSRFLVRFIGSNDYTISDRYSILVNQFIESRGAHSFFETLKEFSRSQTLFSQIQPGFIAGNINSVENPSENVLGLFHVTSVSSERVYFNYRDFYPDEDLPPFFVECNLGAPRITPAFPAIINTGLFVFAGFNGDPDFGQGGPWAFVEKECGDCTEIGNSEPPEFWENE